MESAKAEEACKHYEAELYKIEEEWKSFLRHFLKEGFYFQDGVISILKEMVDINYCPTKEDFPAFLDSTSRQCLIGEYNRLKSEAEASKLLRKDFSRPDQIT